MAPIISKGSKGPLVVELTSSEERRYRSLMEGKAQDLMGLCDNSSPLIQWNFVEEKKSVTISKAFCPSELFGPIQSSNNGSGAACILFKGSVEVNAELFELVDLLVSYLSEDFRKNMKSLYPEFTRGSCLKVIDQATPNNIFQSLALKWAGFESIKGTQKTVRDNVYLEYCNVMERGSVFDRSLTAVIALESIPRSELSWLDIELQLNRYQMGLNGFILRPAKRKDAIEVIYICQEPAVGDPSSFGAVESALRQKVANVADIPAVIERRRLRGCKFIDKSRWIPSDLRMGCALCLRPFTPLRLKHHCRVCGEVVCAPCAPAREIQIQAVGLTRVRVCTRCVLKVREEAKKKFEEERSSQKFTNSSMSDLVHENLRLLNASPAVRLVEQKESKFMLVSQKQDTSRRALTTHSAPSPQGRSNRTFSNNSAGQERTDSSPKPLLRSLTSSSSTSSGQRGREGMNSNARSMLHYPLPKPPSKMAGAPPTTRRQKSLPLPVPAQHNPLTNSSSFSYTELQKDNQTVGRRGKQEASATTFAEALRRVSMNTAAAAQATAEAARAATEAGFELPSNGPLPGHEEPNGATMRSAYMLSNQTGVEVIQLEATLSRTLSVSSAASESSTPEVQNLLEEINRLKQRAETAESRLQEITGQNLAEPNVPRSKEELKDAMERAVYAWYREVRAVADAASLTAHKESHRNVLAELHELIGLRSGSLNITPDGYRELPQQDDVGEAEEESPEDAADWQDLDEVAELTSSKRVSEPGKDEAEAGPPGRLLRKVSSGADSLDLSLYDDARSRANSNADFSASFDPSPRRRLTRCFQELYNNEELLARVMEEWRRETDKELDDFLRFFIERESPSTIIRGLRVAVTVFRGLLSQPENPKYTVISTAGTFFKNLDGSEPILEFLLLRAGYLEGEGTDQGLYIFEAEPAHSLYIWRAVSVLQELVENRLQQLVAEEEDLML